MRMSELQPIPVIVSAKRTPIGRYGGIFKGINPEQLAAEVITVVMREVHVPVGEIDDVILGNVVGPGGNLARLSALCAGLPVTVPGFTVDRQCGSGLEAINLAARLIQSGAGDVYIAGGVESTSRAPWRIEKPESLYGLKPPQPYNRARFSPDSIGDPDMGIAAENVADKYHITRQAQDEYALRSHQKAVKSIRSSWFNDEIAALTINGQTVCTDECPRPDTAIEKLSALPPVFRENGSVTAGNACPVNDGAAVVVLMSLDKAKHLGNEPVLIFEDSVAVGVDPNYLGIAPVPAVSQLLERNQLTIDNIDLVEFNEAFACQVLACLNELAIPFDKVNVGGGALALGHPYGASGAVLVTRLCTEMRRGHGKRGLVTLGIGGGLGLATLFKKL